MTKIASISIFRLNFCFARADNISIIVFVCPVGRIPSHAGEEYIFTFQSRKEAAVSMSYGVNNIHAIGSIGLKNAGISDYMSRKARAEAKKKSSQTSKKSKKKKVEYNFKGVSSQIVRARTVSSASMAYLSARRKVVDLMKKRGAKDYDQDEVEIAIRHAEAILRTARKKKKHLTEEEQAKQQAKKNKEEKGLSENLSEDDLNFEETEEAQEDEQEYSEEELEPMTEELSDELQQKMEQDITEWMRELEEQMALEEQMESLSEFVSPHMTEEDLENLKKKHRAKELLEITKADMEYLKSMFEKYEKEKAENSGLSGLSKDSFSSGSSLGFSASTGLSVGESVPTEGGSVDVSV